MAKKLPVSQFFKDDLPSYAAYDNSRKIASYVDGMKISMRKIIFTLMDKYPGKDKIKTETVSNVTAAHTNYLHGAANLCGVCDTMAQSFVGANNNALITGNSGGFGTRINPTCAAPRYTKIALSDIVRTLINKDDSAIIGQQVFEREMIEPQYFMPIFPILFLNGSSGMSTGFSHDIYPRNPNEVIEYIRKKLNGTAKPKMDLLPWFRGHKGKVEFNSDLNRNESFGVFVKNNMTSYTITELPIGIEYQNYIKYLDKLCDNGTIQDYQNLSSTGKDVILFEIKTTREFTRKYDTDRKLYEIFHLVKSLPETLCCIDENNRIREFNSIQEILDAFIELRLKYYNKRKTYLLESLKNNLEMLASKYIFVKGIVDKTIIVANKKKDDIVKQIEANPKIVKIDGTYEYLLRMPIYSLTNEKLIELHNQIINGKEEYKRIKETTIEVMWQDDLKDLKKVI